MDEQELLRIFNTMHFGDGTVKEARLISEHSIYVVMFNESDLIFEYYDVNNWSLRTAINFTLRKED